MVVRRTEGVVSHPPPWGEDDKVRNGHTWFCGFGGQHGEDRWILEKIVYMFLSNSVWVYPNIKKWDKPKQSARALFESPTYRMVKGHTVDHHEVLQVVFARCVVPVPGNDIERREILRVKAQNKKNGKRK